MNGVENKGYNGASIEMVNNIPKGDYATENNNNADPEKSDNATKERPTWSNSLEFLMSCIALSVGLGNIWRFPFTAYENGGGAFLIPYIIVLFIIGKPIYYMEMAIGQFTSRSAVKIWELSPILKGIGIGQMLGTVSVITYYTSLIALTLYYLFHSFVAELPWSRCDGGWVDCVHSNPKFLSINETSANDTITSHARVASSSELYYLNVVLKQKDDISDGIGAPDWQLSLWLLLAWGIIFVIIVKGVRSSGKVAYFLALFPYVIIIGLLIKACTLDGAADGIRYFFEPQWDKLWEIKIWYKATTQLFFSLSVGMGTIIMFSSYNQFSHNIYRDALIVTTLDTFTSILGGTTIFAILGNLMHTTGAKDINDVVKSGNALAFISYPDTISKFDFAPQLFSVLFFFMLFTLGMGSVVALQSAVITVVWDQMNHIKYWKIALGCSICGFFAGLIYVTPGGQWMLTLVDHYGGTFLIFVLAIFELVGVFWIYGLENFCIDIEYMTNRNISVYWRLCWGIVTPVLMIIIFIYQMVSLTPLTYSDYLFPDSAIAAGWAIFAIGSLMIPLWASWLLAHNKIDEPLNFVKKFFILFKPSKHWGPKDPKLKEEWLKFKADAIENRKRIASMNDHSYLKQKLFIILGRYRHQEA